MLKLSCLSRTKDILEAEKVALEVLKWGLRMKIQPRRGKEQGIGTKGEDSEAPRTYLRPLKTGHQTVNELRN